MLKPRCRASSVKHQGRPGPRHIYFLYLSNPRAKRAGLKGVRAQSARAVTGRRCPTVGRGKTFRRVEKSLPMREMNGLSEGYKWAIDQNWGPRQAKKDANKMPGWFFRYVGTKTFASSRKIKKGQIRSKICNFGHFGPNIGIFGPFRLMPDQKTMQTRCLCVFPVM